MVPDPNGALAAVTGPWNVKKVKLEILVSSLTGGATKSRNWRTAQNQGESYTVYSDNLPLFRYAQFQI
jgi:hypothetical protein